MPPRVMRRFHVDECAVAATLKPWEMMTVETPTQTAQSHLQRLQHGERAILRLPSHHLQNSPLSSKTDFQSSL